MFQVSVFGKAYPLPPSNENLRHRELMVFKFCVNHTKFENRKLFVSTMMVLFGGGQTNTNRRVIACAGAGPQDSLRCGSDLARVHLP